MVGWAWYFAREPNRGSALFFQDLLDASSYVYVFSDDHKKSVEVNLAWTPGFHAHQSNKLFHAALYTTFRDLTLIGLPSHEGDVENGVQGQ